MEVLKVTSREEAYSLIYDIYMKNDLCLTEIIAGIEIHGLSVEAVVEVYATLYAEIEGEDVERGGELLSFEV